MISMEEHLLTKMTEGLTAIGLPLGLVDDFERYLKEDEFEDEFLKSLPEMDFTKVNRQDLKKISDSYGSLKKHDSVYIKKYINTLFSIGKASIKILDNYFQEKDANILLKLGVNPIIVTVLYMETQVHYEYRLNSTFFEFYIRMYKEDPLILQKALEFSSTNGKMCLIAVLVKNSEGGFVELKKALEEIIINSIEVLFRNVIQEKEYEQCTKYVKGGLLSSDKVPESLIENLKGLSVDVYILKLLIATSYLVFDFSGEAKRFIKLMLMCKYNETTNAILGFNQYDNKFNNSEIENINKKLKIPEEYFIAFMAKNIENNRYGDKSVLKERLESNKEEFKKAIPLCTGSALVYLSKMLWDINEGKEYVALAEKETAKEFWAVICKDEGVFSVDDFIALNDYLVGNKKLEDIVYLFKNREIDISYYYNYYTISDMLAKLYKVSPLYERALIICTYLGFYKIINSILGSLYGNGVSDAYNDIVQCLEGKGVEIKYIITFLAEDFSSCTKHNLLYESQNKSSKYLIEKYPEEFLASIKECSVEGRIFLLESLATYNIDKFSATIIEYLNDNSKVVKEKVVGILSSNLKNMDEVIPLLKSKKQNLREGAIKIISSCEDPRANDLLKEALENEKNVKLVKLIMEKLNMDMPEGEKEVGTSLEESVNNILKGKKNALVWLELDTLPKVRLVDSEELASENFVKAIMISYASNIYIEISKEAAVIAKSINPEDLANLCNEVFERWFAAGAESKKKWVLAFCGIHGDFNMVKKFEKQITEWPQHARGAIACEAVRALALNGSDTSLLIVDGISRKFKFKQVKEAAALALDFAAAQMGLDRETLSDRIVPDLGFDESGERNFQFGERNYTVRLTPELALEIVDDKGKIIKALPVQGKNNEEFKLLKKQLKTTVTIQQIRLEMALSMNRKWDKNSWLKLFVHNAIMHQFAIGLVWGIYEENTLKDTFRYMEDGTFNTKEEEEFEISDNSIIGLVHPIELESESLDLWKEQFENYEIKQPFEQLNRAIYLKNDELEKVERFGGTLINGLSLMGKMTTLGWYKGSVQDGGAYYTYVKEDKNIDIGAELEFSGVSIGYENEEVTVYTLTFYKAGTVDRGSYVYDTIKEENLVKPSEVPARFFSEILYQVDKALVSKVGVDENWKKNRM